MISDYDKKYNRLSKLYKSKWTSLKKINGWKHYEVASIDKKNKKIELFSICDKENRVIVDIEDLKNKKIGVAGGQVDKGWLIFRAYYKKDRHTYNGGINDFVWSFFRSIVMGRSFESI